MGTYKFDKFYEFTTYTDKYDMEIQSKTLSWLNKMIDEKILGLE